MRPMRMISEKVASSASVQPLPGFGFMSTCSILLTARTCTLDTFCVFGRFTALSVRGEIRQLGCLRAPSAQTLGWPELPAEGTPLVARERGDGPGRRKEARTRFLVGRRIQLADRLDGVPHRGQASDKDQEL